MAISNEEVLNLVPGDMIRIISEEEAKDKGHWYGKFPAWTTQMNEFCGSVLTVRRVEMYANKPKVYVKENGYYWIASFIDSIVACEEYEPANDTEIESLIFAGV